MPVVPKRHPGEGERGLHHRAFSSRKHGQSMNIHIELEGQDPFDVTWEKGQLSQAIWLSGNVAPVALCGGLGRCGKCRVRFLSTPPIPCAEERAILGEELVTGGWRLACRCRMPETDSARILVPGRMAPVKPAPASTPTPGSATGREESAIWAFDLGTTSIAWRAFGRESGELLCEGRCLNPQAGAGADVLSRVACALTPGGSRLLSGLVRDCLASVMAGIPHKAEFVVVAGNTAMSEIFLQQDVSGLAHAPYHCSVRGNMTCELEGLPPVYLPPLAAPFVGGDITAGLVWLKAMNTPRPTLLADLGTNGEIALVTEHQLCLASVPLGPALEGIGLECGALAAPDVVTSVTISPTGLAAATATGVPMTPQDSFQGISATGCLSLLALLRRMNVLDEEGHLGGEEEKACAPPLARRLFSLVERMGDMARVRLHRDLWVSAGDVEEILKVKAAFAVAVDSLLERAGLAATELGSICIAGALGEHVDAGVLETLGFVPRGTGGLVRAVGNSSLEGACLLAKDPALRDWLARLCEGAIVLAPALETDFQERYVRAMRFDGAS